MALRAKVSTRKTTAKEKALQEVIKERTVRLNANIPHSLYKDLKVKAALEDKSINDLVLQWVKKYVSK